ncbi:Conserved oligomeric golgi complex [Globisporangium polare]
MSEPTTIIVPSTPTPGVASTPSFSGTISPKAFSVEARLDLSLDDLIKERRKEVKKEKKHESVKKETTQKQKTQQKSDSATKSAQTVKRSALVNKNRGLPALPATSKAGESTSKSALRRQKKKKQNAAPQTVVGKKVAAANRQNAQKSKKKLTIVAPANSNGQSQSRNAVRKVTSPKAKGNQKQQQQTQKTKKQAPQQQQQTQKKSKKVMHQQQQPKANKSNANKSGSVKTLTVVTKDQSRKVVRSNNKAAKIRITIKQAPPGNNNRSKKNAKKSQQQKTRIMNVVLPGKVANNFSRSNKASRAQQVVKRVQNRKQSSSKNGSFVVRKPFVSRKN